MDVAKSYNYFSLYIYNNLEKKSEFQIEIKSVKLHSQEIYSMFGFGMKSYIEKSQTFGICSLGYFKMHEKQLQNFRLICCINLKRNVLKNLTWR